MSSAEEDLTTRARIRDAAVLLFGRHGFSATSIRMIASAVKVSPALILHHFGSKDALRQVCDRYVVDQFLSRKDDLVHGDASAAITRLMAETDASRPLIDYLSGMLTSDSEVADELFDALLSGTTGMLDEQIGAGIMREPADRDVVALYLTLYGLVPLIMQRQLSRGLGIEQLTAEGIRRSAVPLLDLYTHGLYVDERFLRAAQEAFARPHGPRSDKGENDPNQDPDPPQRR